MEVLSIQYSEVGGLSPKWWWVEENQESIWLDANYVNLEMAVKPLCVCVWGAGLLAGLCVVELLLLPA